MFKQILVPIDGSPTAALAVAKALGLGSMDQLIEAKGPATGDVGP